MSGRSRAALASIGVAALATLALAAARLDRLAEGLSGTYYETADWQASSARTVAVDVPSTAAIEQAWAGPAPSVFSVAWNGSLFVPRDDTYTFATTSDDGSWVYVDGELVVDNGGRHGALTASGAVRLRKGVHAVLVNYFQDGGTFHFDLRVARAGAPLAPLPEWMLAPRRVSFQRFFASVVLRRSARLFAVIAAAAVSFALVAILWPWMLALGREIAADPLRLALAGVLLGSLLLNASGIWWGLPGSSWAGDEMTPPAIDNGLETWFSHGWFDRWPPLQFYVLAAAYAPVLIVNRIGRLALSGRTLYTVLIFVGRLVSLGAALGAIAAVYRSGARAFSRRAGVFAALALALLVPFVYYAKTANVDMPLTLWLAASFFFFIRLLQTLALGDYLLFAVAATLAVCTKDQAYAAYLAVPFLLVHAQWRRNRSDGRPRPLARAIADRRLLAAAAAAAAVFAACHNLLFNFGGFVRHVKYITGAGSEGYRLFDGGLAGRTRLLVETIRLDGMSWGWPLCLTSVAGFVVAVRDARTRAIALSLGVIVVSYYLGFIDVILYNYDRFLMPVFLVQALFVGVACDRLASSSTAKVWGAAALALVFGYSLLYASAVDAAMSRDSRYTVERWLRAHARGGNVVATMFGLQYLSRLDGIPWMEVRTVEDLNDARPAFYLLNADYARAVAPASEPGRLIEGLQRGTLGYDLALRYRAPAPWPWLPGGHPDLVGPRLEQPVFTFLRNINPTIEVYQRKQPPAL